MKALGLKKKKPARGYSVHDFYTGGCQWSKGKQKGEENVSGSGRGDQKENNAQFKQKSIVLKKKSLNVS